MPEVKWLDDTTIHVALNTATEGTTLNALADAARAISNATGDIDNGTELDLFVDYELEVTMAVALADGDSIAELYRMPSVDDTNFPEGSTSLDPARIHLVGTFINVGTGTDQRAVLEGQPLGPRKQRFLLKNISGQAFASDNGNFLRVKAYALQSTP